MYVLWQRILFNNINLITLKQKCPASLGTTFKTMEWIWKTHLPFDTKDGQWLKSLAWHRQKVGDDGMLYIDGYDPAQLIQNGQKVMSENGATIFELTEIIERKDHPGKPAGNNAYFKARGVKI